MKRLLILTVTHLLVGAAGLALGICTLPILVAQPGPSAAEIAQAAERAMFTATMRCDLLGSDALH